MGEIRIVGPSKRRGYPYLVCKKNIITVCNVYNLTFMFKYDFLFLSLSSSHIVRTLKFKKGLFFEFNAPTIRKDEYSIL